MFSDNDIVSWAATNDILIDGKAPEWEDLQPASLDVHLGNDFLVCRAGNGISGDVIDFRADNSHLFKPVHVPDGDYLSIDRNMFVLGTTRERLTISKRIVAEISGKSSVARLGLLIHATAGWVDPGWDGPITLEMATLAPFVSRVYPGSPIGQLTFAATATPSVSGYNGKYVGQQGPTASRYWLNYDEETGTWN